MFKNLLQLYSLVACLISGFIFLVFTGFIVNHTTVYLYPELKPRYHSDYVESNSAYLQHYSKKRKLYNELREKSDKDITDMRLAEKKDLDERHYKQITTWAKIDIIFEIQWLFLTLLFLLIHWGLYCKSVKGAQK